MNDLIAGVGAFLFILILIRSMSLQSVSANTSTIFSEFRFAEFRNKPKQSLPIRTICNHYKNSPHCVWEWNDLENWELIHTPSGTVARIPDRPGVATGDLMLLEPIQA